MVEAMSAILELEELGPPELEFPPDEEDVA